MANRSRRGRHRVSTRSEDSSCRNDSRASSRPASIDRDGLRRRDHQRLAGGLDAGGERPRPRRRKRRRASASPAASSPTSRSCGSPSATRTPTRSTRARRPPVTDIGVLHALNRGLIYFDKDLNLGPVAGRPTLPKISADGLTYTFTLRDAKYSNGDPIVAGDLVFAWKRLARPAHRVDLPGLPGRRRRRRRSSSR